MMHAQKLISLPDIDIIEQRAKSFFVNAQSSHDWEHTLRVRALCERIGTAEGADMIVLITAALLHDIGRRCQDDTKGMICHAEEGARIAQDIITDIQLSDAQKANVLHSIRAHRYRNTCRPATLEAKVLFDADKIDSIGAIGIARAYLFAGEIGAMLHNKNNIVDDTTPYSKDDTGYREYKVKLCKIKDRMLTPTGKRIAYDRHQFMERFFERFLAEYGATL